METLTPEQIKSKYGIGIKPKGEVFTPGEIKSKYSISDVNTETRESRIAQGLPVGTGDNVKPTFGGEVVRGIAKPFVKLGASVKAIGEVAQGKKPTGITSKFLGNVRPIGEGFDVTKGLTPENITAVKDSVGTGFDIASNIPIVKGAVLAKELATQPFKQAIKTTAKEFAKEGAIQGGLSSAGQSLQRDEGFGDFARNTVMGTGIGAGAGMVLGPAIQGLTRGLTKTPSDVISQQVDKNLRKLNQQIGTDITKLEDSAFRQKKGFDLLNKEASNLDIPDTSAPLGSGKIKQFDITNPKDLILGVQKLDEKITGNARKATEEASAKGFKIDTNKAKSSLISALQKGEIGKATATRLMKQLDSLDNDPVKAFDWVQGVNKNWKADMTKSSQVKQLAEDIAKTLRNELNIITDRVGYGEAYGNNQELKKLLVKIAKKSNKNFNVGSMTDDFAIDTAFSVLTGNPAYLARSVGAFGLKTILNKLKKDSLLKPLKATVKGIGKLPSEANLPSTKLKKERLLLNAPKAGTPTKSINTPINVPSQKAINQGTEIVPRTLPKSPTNIFKKAKDLYKNIPNKQGGFATGIGYKNTGNLTTKILKDLEGKTTVSKQYILDATNRGELKQVERDITRQILDTMPDGQVNVKEFADKVKSELLPLKVKGSDAVNPKFDQYSSRYMQNEGSFSTKYDNIALPDELRGKVANYKENIYESPIATSAGDVHFGYTTKNYFGHTRIEDMADNKTRRVIEVQSDLYQKGNLEDKTEHMLPKKEEVIKNLTKEEGNRYVKLQEVWQENKVKMSDAQIEERAALFNKAKENFKKGSIGKLQQYNDPTAHFRMIREEIKKASQDGKTKLQFPTGETAMKIEGLGDRTMFTFEKSNGFREIIKPEDMKTGMTVWNQMDGNHEWIITDVLGDGKFKAVPKSVYDRALPSAFDQTPMVQDSLKETFDISGKVDTNNPIYKFYEKDVQKYLNKFGGKRVVDDKGVSWIEVPITKEQGKAPVEAFGKIQLGTIGTGALVGTGALAGVGTVKSIAERNAIKYERPKEVAPQETKKIDTKKLGNAIMQLESSGGTNKANADAGEMKWLMGLTEVAIKELKRMKRIDDTFNKNNREDVIDAGIKYFELMKERNPKLTDAEIYVDKYWSQAKSKEQRQKKIDEFNRLIK